MSQSRMPSLSVLVPNYNDADCIGNALESICTQSLVPSEVIVIDDGSTDNSIEVIQEYARRYPFLRLERNDRNRGVLYTVNRGLNLVKGEYFFSGSTNDQIFPGFFEKTMNLLSQYPQAGMCFSNIEVVNATTGERRVAGKRWRETAGYLSGAELAAKLEGGNMYGLSWITRRDLMVQLGGYLNELEWHSDWFLHHVIAFRYGTCYIPEPLAVQMEDEPGSYGSGMHKLDLQRQVFIEVLRLFCSQQYRDIIPYVVSGRFLAVFRPVITLSTISKVIQETGNFDRSISMLLKYLIWEMAQPYTEPVRNATLKACDKLGQAGHGAVGLVVNRFEQVYARAFHEYDRMRNRVRTGGKSNK